MMIPLLTILILWQAASQPGVRVDAIEKAPGKHREITRFSADAIPALIEALADEDAWARDWASTALGKIGKAAVPALLEALKDGQARGQAPRALGEIGAPAAAATPALTEFLKGEDLALQLVAAEALGKIGPSAQAAVPALLE